jgi:hypothetical protein
MKNHRSVLIPATAALCLIVLGLLLSCLFPVYGGGRGRRDRGEWGDGHGQGYR